MPPPRGLPERRIRWARLLAAFESDYPAAPPATPGFHDALARWCAAALGARAAVLALAADGRLRLVGWSGCAPPPPAAWRIVPLGSGVPLAVAVRERRLVKVEHAGEELSELLACARGPAAWAAFPLVRGRTAIGGVALAFARRADLAGVEATAGIVARLCRLGLERAARTGTGRPAREAVRPLR